MNARQIATQRWRTHTSAAGLTWGLMLDGGPIIETLARHVMFAGAAVLEIGPGYGRLLRALIGGQSTKSEVQRPKFLRATALRFDRYVGLDISAHWTRELTAEFGRHKNVRFIHGAAEEADALLIGQRFDTIVSLLTWKHLFPDFGAAARCCHKLLAPDGRLIFDLPETGVAWPVGAGEPSGKFEQETGTFTRTYARGEVESLLSAAGLAVVTFDEIEHAPGKRRLLLVARTANESS